MMRARFLIVALLISPSAAFFSLPALADVACATPAQMAKIAETVAQTPAALPNVLAVKAGLPEAVLVTGLDSKTAIGTSGSAFADVWASLTAWERPAFLIQLDRDNTLEVFGRVGPTIRKHDGNVLIESPGAGVGGHFKPESIASIYMIRVPNGEAKTVYGALFFNADGKSLLGVYSVDSPRPAVIAMLSKDSYQKTWDLIAEQPRVCAH